MARTFYYNLDRETVEILFDCIQYRIDRLDNSNEENILSEKLDKIWEILNEGWPFLNKMDDSNG